MVCKDNEDENDDAIKRSLKLGFSNQINELPKVEYDEEDMEEYDSDEGSS
ncbi:uncharacterized protein G2W53_032541 [Senna tora]|uniref:Uncharacterized protein n=1 Tax=Senna tora TaxID=362788 RepID=A0A834W6E4_9FABA|nr:uncharacterized protein G2W53_032541 [Senna tora]